MRADEQNNSSNIARFFTHNRQIAWVALLATLVWGVFGYMSMPKRKDPDIPVRVGLAIATWPGIAADKVEQLVTRKIEQAATGNTNVKRVESTTQDNVSVVQVRLLDSIENTDQEFQDIGQRLSQIDDLPDGAGPITWISDFGDTAALMLTVASPSVSRAEIELRARGVREAIEQGAWRRDVRACESAVLLSRVDLAGDRGTAVRHVCGAGAARRCRRQTFGRCPWAAAPGSTWRRPSQTRSSAPTPSSSSTRDSRPTTSIRMCGVRSSSAIRRRPGTASPKWRATVTPIGNSTTTRT